MFNKTLRRCFAASALAMLADLTGISAASADSMIEIVVHRPLEIEEDAMGLESSFEENSYGFPYGSSLTVEWWEGNNGTATLNPGCVFSVWVDEDGDYESAGAFGAVERTAHLISGSRHYAHSFRLDDGCNPSKVNASNSFLRIYPTHTSGEYEPDLPVIISEVKVNSGNNAQKRTRFKKAPVNDRGTNSKWSISDACFEEHFLYKNFTGINSSGPDYSFQHEFYEGIGEELDNENVYVFLNANVNPVLEEGADGADLSSDGGVLIFPNRETHSDGDRALVICDSGYLPDAGNRFPDRNATFSLTRTSLFSKLPHPRATDDSLNGQGLANMLYRAGARSSDLSHEDVLSVLTYNVASIPDKPGNFVKCFFAWQGGGWASGGNSIGRACDSRVGNRKRRLKEISESVRQVKPDMVVLLEAFQDHFSGYGVERWNSDNARDDLIDELDDLYSFASVKPTKAEIDASGNDKSYVPFFRNPTSCIDVQTTLDPDQTIYPDQTQNDMSHIEHCAEIRRDGLDSGVLIGRLKSSTSGVDTAFTPFENADGPDKGSSKGVRYYKIRKSSQDYHVFGTHLQSSNSMCSARVKQLRTLVDYVKQKTPVNTNADTRVIITGDLNIDPILNNHNRKNDEKSKTCRNELEYLVQTLRSMTASATDRVTAGRVNLSPFSMPFSNDCLLNRHVVGSADSEKCGTPEMPGNKSKLLDHLVWAGAKPTRAGSIIFRQAADGQNHNLDLNEELSGHYPMLTTLDYRSSTSSNNLWTFYEYGDTTHVPTSYALRASKDYDRPVTCPYGVPTEYWPGSTASTRSNVEPDLVCLPSNCYGNTSNSTGDECNPATHAGAGAVRDYCRSSDENGKNYAAPCIIPAGYQNLARTTGVTVTASSYWGSSSNQTTYLPSNVVDGKVLFSSDTIAQRHFRTWAADTANEANHWVKVKLPVAQYVKRVRFRNLGGIYGTASHWGTKTYSLFFNDVFGEENDSCPTSDQDSIDSTHGDATVACPKTFSDADQATAQTQTYNGSTYPDPNVWHVHEVTDPVLTDEIVFLCDDYLQNGCGFAEIEIYGGAE